MNQRLKKQLEFIYEIDKIKTIFRRTRLFDDSRFENDAEHSWHLAMMAAVLHEHANEPVELCKVIKMVLIHDLVEIYAGDYIVYTEKQEEKKRKEHEGAEKIFGLLPEDQREEFFGLWLEFERRDTPEARFANAIDRLEPLMQNYYSSEPSWKKYKISYDKVFNTNKRMAEGSEELWDYAKFIIDEGFKKFEEK